MKILFVMPRLGLYKKGKGFRKNLTYAPLTLTTLASLVPNELNAEMRIVDEGVEECNYDTLSPDIACITGITGHIMRSYEIADGFRKRGITVILGGVHSTLMPEEAKQHADAVVIGHAYRTFPQALRDWKSDALKEFYRDENPCFENIPIPRRDLLKKSGYITINTTQAVFGCPQKCEFCVISATKSGYHHRPIPDIINEIRALRSKLVLFLDPSPIEDKNYTKELYRAMIPLKINWMGLSTSKIIDDDELLSLAHQSGCAGLLIGFESVSERSLDKMNKSFNSVEKHYRLIKELHKRNIAIMGCFVFGSDEDEKTIFKETVDFCLKTGIDLPRFTVYTPFPTTTLFNRLNEEGRILTTNWTKYNCQNVVFHPKNMTAKELEDGLEYAWRESYRVKNIAKRLLKARSRRLWTVVANLGYRFYSLDHARYK
ncbi:MAG: radical SAM protein [Candidatus Omnitrophica bacterium]|nr:radical SAM protein [Candidatus Omnitrophota bacterium]